SSGDIFLEVQVGGTPLTPRQRVDSAPYALMCIDARNVVGGTVSASSLQVTGDAQVSGSVKVGADNATCTSAKAGALRWNATATAVEFCDGASWRGMGSSNNGVGSSASNPGASCQHIQAAGASSGTGTYWIKPNAYVGS